MAKKQIPKRAGRKSAAKKPAAAKPAASKKRATVAQKTPAVTTTTPAKPKQRASRSRSRAATLIDLSRIWDELGILRPIEFRVTLARPDDLLVCDFIFDNLKLDDGKLVRKVATATATLIVEFPPQSFGEQAFLDKTGSDVPNPIPPDEEFQESSKSKAVPPKNVPVSNAESFGSSLPFARIRIAGRSRIAFTMPQNEKELPFTLDAILDAARRWPMRLDSSAAPEPPARGLGVLDDALKDQTFFNKAWLASITTSGDWNRAGEALFGALGARLEAPITAAATDIAAQATAAINSGKREGLNDALKRAMTTAVDELAAKYPALREAKTRHYALAALSLKSTQALTTSSVNDFDISAIDILPFLPVFLSPHQPSPLVTALELPYRVILSPIPVSNWWHAKAPVVHSGRTELWHTRLTHTTNGVGPDPDTKVRAIWSPDYPLETSEILDAVNAVPPKPFRMSLDPLDRQMLVKLMAGFNEKDDLKRTFIPHSSASRRLSLSSLGALLDAAGDWVQLPAGVSLEQWRHLANLGRDHYVRVVYRGSVCHPGNSTSLIKVTERKFEWMNQTKKTGRVALLRQRFFIVVRQPVVVTAGAGHAFQGRNFPFGKVEILTRVTPSLQAPGLPGTLLDDPDGIIYGPSGIPNRACFWPMLDANRNFMFQIAVTDLAGQRQPFAMPLLFVGVEANSKPEVMAEIIKQYNLVAKSPRRTASMGSAAICYAPIKAGSEGDPRLPTSDMTFAVAPVTGIPVMKPQFYPEVERAHVGISAIQRLLQQPDAVTEVEYPQRYKEKGFGAAAGENPGEVFLKTVTPYGLEFGDQVKSDALGALATPSMAIQGLSRVMGPVAAQPPGGGETVEDKLATIIGNSFDPTEFFKGATILGGINLSDLLTVVTSLAGADVPKLLSKQLPDRIEARFNWQTDINDSDPAGLFVPNAGGQTTLAMEGVVSTPIAPPGPATYNAEASIVNFKVNLFGFIIIWFDRLRFLAKGGSKPDVAVDMHPVDTIAFGGPLEFVNTLKDIIPSNGFSDPPSLSITPSGISAGYSLNIPSVAVGIFALEHVSIGAGFSLPFDAKPVEVRFNFCERQRPFSLTVSLLGGGGFFAIGIGTEGVREIEAAIEFGAALSIDLGVASGSVEIKAGVYFHWMQKSVELAGYVRLHGELSVLGLISASLTFNLQLAFLKETGHSVVWGEATLTVEVEVLFFSASVSVQCRREFGGSDGDPRFIELVPDQATWANYCEGFAAEAA
jgi:hypothetical protein